MQAELQQLAETVLSTAPSRRGKHFAAREVAVDSEKKSPWAIGVADGEVHVPWPDGDLTSAEFLRATHTNAFLVVRDGKITREWYAEGVTPEQLHSSWSVAKSLVSLLLGRVIDQGLVSLDDTLTDILPEFRTGDGFDGVTVHDLVNMASGIDVPEDAGGSGLDVGTRGLYLTKDIPAFLHRFRTLFAEPGTVGSYRSADTAYLGLIIARVTGRPLAELASEWLWKPIGAETPARWNLDRPDGGEKAFCCFNATARDFARIGAMMAAGGTANGQELVSQDWVNRISVPSPVAVDGLAYSTHWWHVERDGDEGDFSAIGIHGQYIYVNPKRNVTIVKLSDYGLEQHEWETLAALRHIAVHAAA